MNRELEYKDISNREKSEILDLFETRDTGLNEEEVEKRLDEYGDNVVNNKKKKTPLYFIFEALKDKFVLILILLAVHQFASTRNKWL